MRTRWLLTLSGVLLAALLVLALLLALAPREVEARAQTTRLWAVNSISSGELEPVPSLQLLVQQTAVQGKSEQREGFAQGGVSSYLTITFEGPPRRQVYWDSWADWQGNEYTQQCWVSGRIHDSRWLPYGKCRWTLPRKYWPSDWGLPTDYRFDRMAMDCRYLHNEGRYGVQSGPASCQWGRYNLDGFPCDSDWHQVIYGDGPNEMGGNWGYLYDFEIGIGLDASSPWAQWNDPSTWYLFQTGMVECRNLRARLEQTGEWIDINLGPSMPGDQTNAPCDCPVGCSSQTTNWVGGPINTRSGNYHYSHQDLSIAALGGPLRFERSYNSLETGLYTVPLGYGWTHNYDMDLTFPGEAGGEPGTVIVKGCHGSRFRFADNGNGTYTAWPGVWATLTRTTGVSPTYYLCGVDQSLYVFTATGQLVEVRDPQGHPIQLTYSGGRLTRVQDTTGARFLAFSYDAQGRLIEIRDPISRTVRYGYSPTGDLTVVTDTRGFTWTYTYTGTHLLYDVRDPLNRVVERTDYDAEGRAVRQWDGMLGPPLQIQYGAGSVVTITDPLGNVAVDRYNAYGTLASQSTAAGISRRTYDANLNWKTTTDANGHTTGYTFNTMGLPERVTDALGNTTRMTYDGLNRLRVVTDALGNMTRYEYGQASPLPITVTDALGGLVVNTYNPQGLLIRTVDHGVTTTYEYDQWGQRTAITDALCTGAMNCAPTRYEYDAVGRLVTTTNPARQVTVNQYDAADNLIRVTQNYTTAGGQNWQNTYNLVTQYEYDRAGNRVALTDTIGRVTRNWYDAANRLISVTVNYSPTVGPNYQNQWNLTTRYGYDAVGNQVAVTDTLGRVTRNWYDAANRLISTTVNYSPTVGPNHQNQWNITTWYGYDAVGNRVAVTDTLGRVTRYGYDALNRLVAVTDTLTGTTRYAYDALSRQTVVTDASGVAVYSAHDALGRLIQTRDALNNVTRYGYDGLGRRVVMTDANGVATGYQYDLLGRLTAVIENQRIGESANNQTNIRTEYAYDVLGNRTVITDARGNATRYAYDALGRLISETNPLTQTTRYAYDALGRQTVITAADGAVTRYTYDALGRLAAVQYPTSTVQYAYDALGNRTAMTDTTGVTRWVYDALNRPITISAPYSGTVGYRYDALGNRTQLIYPTGQVVTYTYDAVNRLIQVTDYASRFTRYGYDRAGRLLTTRLPNGITTTYRYDGAGRLTNLTHAGRWWTLAAYTYTLDAVGNRIAVEERVLAPNPPVYLPLVMRNYGGGGGQGMSAPAAGPQVAPFVSPLPVPAPEPQPFDSPLETPVEDSSSRVPAPFRARLLLPDLSLLLFAPLALVSLAQRKKGWRWAWPLAAALLVVAVVAIGASLAGGVAPATALVAPQPFLSVLEPPPPQGGCTYPAPVEGGRVISYTYDPLYRLTGAAYSSGECYRYGYDRVGNRATYTTTLGLTVVTTYTYDAANRLSNVRSPTSNVQYTWDNQGNLRSNGVFTYTYDAAGRMVRAQSITATLVYTYNGDGLLMARAANGSVTRYTWDLAAGLPQMLGDGSTLYVSGVGEWSAAQGWAYYLPDGLGSVRQLADANGYIVQRYAYGPFGEPLSAEGSRTSRMRYTGEQWDGDAGLVYLRARWYDPAVGRFTTPDPFPGFAALPQTLHPYTYCQNNPVNLTDPSGKIPLFVLPLIVTLPLLVGGVAFVADWVIQVLDNMCYRDLSFWEAVHHGNINWSEAAGVGVTAAGTTVIVLGGVQMVLAGGTLLLWQVGVWAQSPTAMTWGNTVSNWAAQYGTALWTGAASGGSSSAWSPTVGELRAAGSKDAHHVIQDAAVRDLPGYDTNAAPGVQLPGPSTQPGTPHYEATQIQRLPGGSTYGVERAIAYNALRAAGLSHKEALAALQRADAYFATLGVNPNTPTRIPGNR